MNPSGKKQIIMLLVDTLMDITLQEAIKNGKAPALQFLIENGYKIPNLVSPFPTMSVNVDSTLLTGVYSDQHKVPGLVWFNKKENRIINYGGNVRELIKLGLKQSMEDIFYNLNHNHLSKKHKTIHETLVAQDIQTASINTLMYRGNQSVQITFPFLMSLVTGMRRKIFAYAPNLFSYGAMAKLNRLKRYSFFWQKYGFNDKFTANELIYLIERDMLPALTIAYFPDLDQRIHKKGRMNSKGVEKVDKQLQTILNTYSTWEEALKNNIWIVLGDNGQAWIEKDRNKALIDLRKLLKTYRIPKLKDRITSSDEVILCTNERMCFIYTLDSDRILLENLAKTLQKDERIDVIAWKKDNSILVTSGIQDGKLIFHPSGDFRDEYGQSWSIEGDTAILDLSINKNMISYGVYPDALARLYTTFFSHEGDYLVVNAKPGYEFLAESSPTHVGGASHGGLHEQDSLVPMIVTGTDTKPKNLRILDIKDWILSLI
ncbi:alkaline phosphatase family protein [Metabacillus sediminilitoris]|uniref:Alkaline phosphatase family protein n=1 Tax=Metabacillus sediminilitoris TaxID=2567941 RepID=A0A4S4BZ34_9BACI|nr:alkaline phosphatase family protein [Metabacillus sediminilitoris]QGQ48739.1 alkaline phosphatase family protein [Metabacillus sediminilitoris]THF79845.1 alkaline phosphatase family protein [Metabacillus sediminilitoris]